MIHEMKKSRKYTLRRRAEGQAQTRQRIIEAAVKLHEELGPKFTTISGIAEKAGVERLTVYRHFPDELSLFRACSGHWRELHPAPDPSGWASIRDASSRSEAALTALYAYYRRTEGMWSAVMRDESEVAAVKTVMKGFYAYLQQIADDLAGAWHARGRSKALLHAAVSHSVHFSTWQSLNSEKLKDTEISQLMVLWFSGIADDR